VPRDGRRLCYPSRAVQSSDASRNHPSTGITRASIPLVFEPEVEWRRGFASFSNPSRDALLRPPPVALEKTARRLGTEIIWRIKHACCEGQAGTASIDPYQPASSEYSEPVDDGTRGLGGDPCTWTRPLRPRATAMAFTCGRSVPSCRALRFASPSVCASVVMAPGVPMADRCEDRTEQCAISTY
jgi:hypothetical protein